MGVFAEHAPEYLVHNIPVFPTGGETGKKALVRNYQKMGVPASRKLLEDSRFDGANLGFMCGPRNRITVLDVDTPDRTVFNRALGECGETAIKIQTASGKFQAWYRHNGERRKIRPIKGEEIDVLGGGMVVAPPSIRPDLNGEAYRFLDGNLDDINDLPAIREGALPPEIYGRVGKISTPKGIKVPEGERTNALYDELRRIALQCETIDELAFKGAGINEAMMDPPLTEAEVVHQARGVWKLKTEGRLIPPGSGAVVIGRDEGRQLYEYPPALALWHYLKTNHGPEHEFAIGRVGLAKALPFGESTITKARSHLVDAGFIALSHQGGGDKNPNRYKFGKW
jgi:hypothetical protein